MGHDSEVLAAAATSSAILWGRPAVAASQPTSDQLPPNIDLHDLIKRHAVLAPIVELGNGSPRVQWDSITASHLGCECEVHYTSPHPRLGGHAPSPTLESIFVPRIGY